MRRLALLFAAGTLWLFLAAIPAFADGGPHVANDNSGISTLTADGCAGCHRAHTAQGEGLLVEASEQDLCESCHGSTATGAATDVMTGVQYVKGSLDPNGTKATGTVLGYLRDGGFQQAHIGSSDGELTRVGYYRAVDTVSFRMKVPVETTAEDVTSAHLDLDGAGGVTPKKVMWGKGASNTNAPSVSMECSSCHNPHGNGQYRILNDFKNGNTEQLTQSTAVAITSVKSGTDRFFTAEAHSLVVGDIVTISGVTGATPSFNTAAQYIVKTVSGNTFTVAATSLPTATPPGPKSADIANPTIDITADGTGGTVVRWKSIVDDAPLPAASDNRNYTVIQVKGTQGTNSSYLLYESNVTGGSYASTAGDYFHRTVPWNPDPLNRIVNGSVVAGSNQCNTTNGTLPTACNTANDAPNGRPSTTATQIAFNDQISAWCSTCHTRYYSSTNSNPDGEPSSSTDNPKTIASASGNDILSPVNATSNNNFGYGVGDSVQFSAVSGTYYVQYYATSGTGTSQYSILRVSTTQDGDPIAAPASTGTVTRLIPFAASSWYLPRDGGDTSYKYQHQTTTNRACTTCHVGHGSDAKMQTTGLTTFSNDLDYPGGVAGTSGYNSRLLKIDNRGTCQACHDPTLTATAGQQLGNQGTPTVP